MRHHHVTFRLQSKEIFPLYLILQFKNSVRKKVKNISTLRKMCIEFRDLIYEI